MTFMVRLPKINGTTKKEYIKYILREHVFVVTLILCNSTFMADEHLGISPRLARLWIDDLNAALARD